MSDSKFAKSRRLPTPEQSNTRTKRRSKAKQKLNMNRLSSNERRPLSRESTNSLDSNTNSNKIIGKAPKRPTFKSQQSNKNVYGNAIAPTSNNTELYLPIRQQRAEDNKSAALKRDKRNKRALKKKNKQRSARSEENSDISFETTPEIERRNRDEDEEEEQDYPLLAVPSDIDQYEDDEDQYEDDFDHVNENDEENDDEIIQNHTMYDLRQEKLRQDQQDAIDEEDDEEEEGTVPIGSPSLERLAIPSFPNRALPMYDNQSPPFQQQTQQPTQSETSSPISSPISPSTASPVTHHIDQPTPPTSASPSQPPYPHHHYLETTSPSSPSSLSSSPNTTTAATPTTTTTTTTAAATTATATTKTHARLLEMGLEEPSETPSEFDLLQEAIIQQHGRLGIPTELIYTTASSRIDLPLIKFQQIQGFGEYELYGAKKLKPSPDKNAAIPSTTTSTTTTTSTLTNNLQETVLSKNKSKNNKSTNNNNNQEQEELHQDNTTTTTTNNNNNNVNESPPKLAISPTGRVRRGSTLRTHIPGCTCAKCRQARRNPSKLATKLKFR